jgi:hypothetical protein
LKKLMKLKEDFIGHLGGILVPFFGPVFWPNLWRTFHHPEVPVFEALSFIECVRGVLHVSRM